MRRLLVAVTTAILVSSAASQAAAHGLTPEIDRLIWAAAKYRGASYVDMQRVLHCESDHYDPRVIGLKRLGKAKEKGIAQIHPRGLGPLFESRTGDYSASDSIYFMAYAFTHGLKHHWSCK